MTDKDEWTALFYAVKQSTNESVVRAEIDAGADVNKTDKKGWTVLFYAVEKSNNEKVVRALIDAGAHVNMTDEGEKTALFYAVQQSKNESVVRALIDAGADVNMTDENGWIPLFYAVQQSKNESVVRALIDAGADVNMIDEYGWIPLFYAVQQSNNEKVVRALIVAGAHVNMTDKGEKTALFYAVQQSKNESVVRALIGAGADVNMTDENGWIPLFYAVQQGFNEIVIRTLIDGLDVRDKYGRTAHFYVPLEFWGDSPLNWLLEGGNRNLKLEDNCNVDIVSFLIERWLRSKETFGPGYASFETFKKSILDVFAKHGIKRERFIKAIVNVLFLESLNFKKQLYNMQFVTKQSKKCKALGKLYYRYIIHDHDSLEKESKMQSILDLLNVRVTLELSEVLQLLLELDADPDSADSDGNTVLHNTTRLPLLGTPQATVLDLCNELKRFGATFNKKNHQGQTALLFGLSANLDQLKDEVLLSAVKTLVHVCMFLVKQGSRMDQTSKSGESVFHLIIKFFSRCLKVKDEAIRKDVLTEAIKLLDLFPTRQVAKENNINKPDVHLNSPLHLWASLSLPSHLDYTRSVSREEYSFKALLDKILKYLLDCGAKVNARNENDETPLHMCKTLVAVKLLLDAGANPNDRNSSGRSPLLVAAEVNNVGKNPDYFYVDVMEDPETFWRSVLEKELDPWTTDKQGECVLSILIKSESFILARAMVEVACKEHYATNDVKLLLLKVICKDESRHTHWKTTLVEVILKSASKSNLSLDSPLRLCCRNIVRFGMFDVKPYQTLLQQTNDETNIHDDGQPPSKKIRKDEPLKNEEGKLEESSEDQVTYDSVHYIIAKKLLSYGGVNIHIRDSSGESCLGIAEACPSLKDFLMKPVEIDAMPTLIPWTSFSDKHKDKLSKVARRHECEMVDQIWYHRNHIGAGSFAFIFVGINEKDGREVAIKRIEKLRMQGPEDKREIRNLTALADCEQIVRYISFFEDEHFSYISLELMEGNLEECLDGSTIDATQATVLCKDVVVGLKFLHEQNILHRDLKPQNVLYKVHPNLCLKIADFGLSRIVDSVSTTVYGTHAGTKCWIAPEVMKSKTNKIDKNCFEAASDMFSCGLLLHYILSGRKHPFSPTDCANKSELQIDHEKEDNIMKGNLEGLDDTLSPEATHLVKWMLVSNGKDRPRAEEGLEHPLFWSNEKKVDFLKVVGNQEEFQCSRAMKKTPLTPVEADLEKSFGTIVKHGRWNDPGYSHMPNIHNEMKAGKGRRYYDTSTVVELVRFIRNTYEHYREKSFLTPLPIEQMLLNDFIFLKYFPDLLMEVYKAVTTHGWHQTREDVKYVMNKK